MKMKKLISAVMTVAMSLALAVPAFAATNPLEPTLKIGSTTQIPTINIQMPTSPAIVLNPYKLQVTLGKDKITDQIASPMMSVVNLSDCPIQVCAQASAAVAGNAALATSAITASSGANDVFINIACAIGTEKDARTTLIKTDGTPETAAKTLNLTASAQDIDATLKLDGTAAAAATNTLKAAASGKAAADSSAFNFTFYGGASSKGPWVAKDTVTPTVVFKFIPLAAA